MSDHLPGPTVTALDGRHRVPGVSRACPHRVPTARDTPRQPNPRKDSRMTTDTATTYPARVALVCPRCEHGIPLTELASWVNAYASGEQWDETCPHCGMTVALHLECVGTTPALPASAYPQDHPLGWPTSLPHPKHAAADRRAARQKDHA